MIEKARTYLDRELRRCFRNKQHAIERCNPESDEQNAEIKAISEKINIIQFLLRCVDTVETMKEERKKQ